MWSNLSISPISCNRWLMTSIDRLSYKLCVVIYIYIHSLKTIEDSQQSFSRTPHHSSSTPSTHTWSNFYHLRQVRCILPSRWKVASSWYLAQHCSWCTVLAIALSLSMASVYTVTNVDGLRIWEFSHYSGYHRTFFMIMHHNLWIIHRPGFKTHLFNFEPSLYPLKKKNTLTISNPYLIQDP